MKRERELREAHQRLADMQRHEQTKQMWHAFSKALPFIAAFLIVCGLGVFGFTTFKIMGDAWMATTWH